MAADGSVVFSTELDEGGLRSALNGLGSKVSSWAGGIGNMLKGVGAALGAVTAGMGALAKTAITYNSSMENYTTNFGVMLGDEAAAIEHVAQLRDMAAKTPFGMEDLANASQTMLSFGLDAEYSMNAMQQLGDISLGNKDRFNSLALAFSQVSSAGKLTGQDLNQMINAGFNPLNTIAEKTGTSIGDLKDFMAGGKGSKEFQKQMKAAQKEVKKMGDNASDGAKMLAQLGEDGMISAEMVGKAMEIETSPGGRFYNGMLKASETFSGMVSTLQDDATALIGKVFEPMTESMTKNLLPLAQNYLQRLSDAFEAGGTEGLVVAIGSVIGDAIGQAAEALPDVLTIASGLLNAIGDGLVSNAQTLTLGLTNAISAIATSGLPEGTISTLGTLASTLLTSLATGFSENAGAILSGITDGLVGLLTGSLPSDLISSLASVAASLITGIAEQIPVLIPALGTALVSGLSAVFESLPELATAAGKLLEGLKNGILGSGDQAGMIDSVGQAIVGGLQSFFDANFPNMKIKIPTFEEIKAASGEAMNSLLQAISDFFRVTLKIDFPSMEEMMAGFNAHYGSNGQIDDTGSAFGNFLMQLAANMTGANEPSGLAMLIEDNMTRGGFTKAVEDDAEAAIGTVQAKATLVKNKIRQEMAASDGEEATGEQGPMSEYAAKMLEDIANGLTDQMDTTNAAMQAVLNGMLNELAIGQFTSIGYQIAAGIASGVRNGGGILAAAMRNLIRQALKAARNEADINSPSGLFRDEVGAYIPAGAAEGVRLNAYQLAYEVRGMMKKAVPSSIGTIGTGLMLGGNYGMQTAAAAASNMVSQTINFNVPVQTPAEFAQTMELYHTYGLTEA